MPTIIFILRNLLQFLTTRFVTTLSINGGGVSRTCSVVRSLFHAGFAYTKITGEYGHYGILLNRFSIQKGRE